MMKYKQYPIGAVISDCCLNYIVVEGSDCGDCSIFIASEGICGNYPTDRFGACSGNVRDDKKDVVFKLIQK